MLRCLPSYLIKEYEKDYFNMGIFMHIRQLSHGSIWTFRLPRAPGFRIKNWRQLCFTGGLDLTIAHSVVSVRAGWDLRDNIGVGTSTTLRYKNMWYQATYGYRF